MARSVNDESGYADVNGARLSYDTAGIDPRRAVNTVVLLHAGIADRRMWDPQFHILARQYPVIRFDSRGYGESTAGEGGYSHAEDLHALLEALRIRQVVLIGCSRGGATAVDFALAHPALTKGLVLVSTVPNGFQLEGEMPAPLAEFIAAYQRQDLARATELAARIWVDGPQRNPDQVEPAVRERARALIEDVLARGALGLAGEEGADLSAAARLAQIRAPTLVVTGELDDPSIRQAGEALAAGIPGAKKVTIHGAAHLLSLEKPDVFYQAVLEFLQKQ
jgi:pimeloyl-ACP methyl ester carboxylesterase